MSLTLGLREGVAPPEGLPLLEHLISLNMQWTLKVEQDVGAWVKEGKKDDGDDCDDTVAMDRMAERPPWTGRPCRRSRRASKHRA